MQKDAAQQAQAAQLPCSPMGLVLVLLVQRSADVHSAVCARAMTALSKSLSSILEAQGPVEWLQPLVHALCHAPCLVLASERIVAEAAPEAGPAAADGDGCDSFMVVSSTVKARQIALQHVHVASCLAHHQRCQPRR